MTDKFPEAFERYQKAIDTSQVKTFKDLKNTFRYWQRQNRLTLTRRQITGLAQQGEKQLGIKGIEKTSITVRNKPQIRFRNIGSGRFAKKEEYEEYRKN